MFGCCFAILTIIESLFSMMLNSAFDGEFGFFATLNLTIQSLFFESSMSPHSGVCGLDAQALRTAIDLSPQRIFKSSSLFVSDANWDRPHASSGKCGGRFGI